MRKFIFLAIAAVTFYFAGMYKNLALLVIFSAEMLLFAVTFIMSAVSSRKISARFKQSSVSTIRGTAQSICFLVKNNGILPLSKAKVKIKARYSGKKAVSKKLFFGALPQSETDISFFLTAPYCGVLRLKFSRIYAYDFLSLFCISKRSKSSLEIITLPQTAPVNLGDQPMLFADSTYNYELPCDTSGSSSEIRQLREYRSSDQIRHIHWNQTARTQQVYVKEFERESGGSISIYLNLLTRGRITLERKNAFYEILYSIISGLLSRLVSVRLFFRDYSMNRDLVFDISGTEELNEAFSELYRRFIKRLKKKESGLYIDSAGAMLIDFDLNWYFDRELIFSFSENNYKNEISTHIFYLPSDAQH